jgi:hypothetical protein
VIVGSLVGWRTGAAFHIFTLRSRAARHIALHSSCPPALPFSCCTSGIVIISLRSFASAATLLSSLPLPADRMRDALRAGVCLDDRYL